MKKYMYKREKREKEHGHATYFHLIVGTSPPTHILVWATIERFLPIGATFRVASANEPHWLQLLLVLTVQ